MGIISKYKIVIVKNRGDIIFTIRKIEFILVMSAIILILNFKVLAQLILYKKFNPKLKEKIMNLIFRLYIIVLMAVVYFPITLGFGKNVIRRYPRIHLILWESTIGIYKIGGIKDVIINIGGNLILLTPFIFFICYYFNKVIFKKREIICMSFEISLFIECSQVILSLLFPNLSRAFDTIDLLCNTISGLLGYYLYKIYISIATNHKIREKVNNNKIIRKINQ